MERIFVDGSGFNGRTSGYCVVWENGPMGITHEVFTLQENRTNNEMEYAAVIEALTSSSNNEIYTDSQLVVNQVAGKWRVNEAHLKPLCQRVQELLKEKDSTLHWIPREENLAGHVLERRK